MNLKSLFLLVSFCLPVVVCCQSCFTCEDAPSGTIFCDDFESGEPLNDRYFEYGDAGGQFVPIQGEGRDGSIGMRALWNPGQVGVGGFKKSFGRTPSNYIGNHAANPDEQYDEIFWRLDLRTQEGWQGGGAAKLSRAMTLAKSNWSQGMIAHIWSGGPGDVFLGMDPASGISESGQLVSTRYNDFNNLRWLGWKHGNIDLFTTSNSNKWYCIEAHVKLNTPGQNDGIFEFWINDTLQAGSYDLNWHGDWNSNPDNMKINAIFVENYWNSGSPVEQERFMDNFVISTSKIGCRCDISTAVDVASGLYDLKVFPNPSNGTINLKSSRSLAIDGYTVEIFNSFGVAVFKSPLIKSINSSFNFSNEGTGLFYYRVIVNNDNIQQGVIHVASP